MALLLDRRDFLGLCHAGGQIEDRRRRNLGVHQRMAIRGGAGERIPGGVDVVEGGCGNGWGWRGGLGKERATNGKLGRKEKVTQFHAGSGNGPGKRSRDFLECSTAPGASASRLASGGGLCSDDTMQGLGWVRKCPRNSSRDGMKQAHWCSSFAGALRRWCGFGGSAQGTHGCAGRGEEVPYSRAGDPAGAVAGESELKIRALLVDGVLREWTTGESHDVTDRSFVVRRGLRLNDTLPGDKTGASGCGSGGRGCWSTAPPATPRRSSCPITIPG